MGAKHLGYVRQYNLKVREDHWLGPFAGNPATMARFVTWLGNLGTFMAFSLQPYPSAVNNLHKDRGRNPISLRDFVARVRKGLAA
jgi:hypothetical protein